MSGDPRFELLGQPCLTCWGRGGMHLGDCPNDDAPRPESGGQQQAAAEVGWVFDSESGWLYGPDPANPRLRKPVIFDLPAEHGQRLADALSTHQAEVDRQDKRVLELMVAGLAEAARPGQELRARVEALTDEWEKRRDWQGITGTTWAADELRAALEDPR